MKIGPVTAIPMEPMQLGQNAGEPSSQIHTVEQSVSQNISVAQKQEELDAIVDKEWQVMDKPIEQANKALQAYDRRIDRVVHDITHTVMYTIMDTKTNEVIAEYPPKKIQDMIAKMWELAGLFVDERV